MKEWNIEHSVMLAYCKRWKSKLSELDGEFIDYLSHQLRSDVVPSAKQIKTLKQIWERVSS